MTQGAKQPPRRNDQGDRREREREERLARALRDNLARRKAQQRARDADLPPPAAPADSSDPRDG